MPAGPAKLAIADRCRAAARAQLVRTATTWCSRCPPPLDTSSGDVTRHHPGAGRPVRRATSPRTRPTGTCCSRSGWPTCPRSAARSWPATASGDREVGPDAHRHGLPVLVRRPGRCAVARAAAGRGDARAAATTSACWRRRRRTSSCPTTSCPAARRCRSRTTGRWPGCGSGPPPTARSRQWLARGRLRRAAPARAQRAEPVDAGADDRRGADRRDVPHVDHEVVDAQRVSGHPAAVAREDRRPHRGVGSGAALADGGAGLRRRRDSQRRRRRVVRVGAAARGLPAAGQVGAVPRPLRRAAQGHGRAAAARCRRWSKRSPTSRS